MRLQETRVPVQGTDACIQLLAKMKLLSKQADSVPSLLCTGHREARTDACQVRRMLCACDQRMQEERAIASGKHRFRNADANCDRVCRS